MKKKEEIDTKGQCQVLSDRKETEQADSIDTESDKSEYSRSVIRSAKRRIQDLLPRDISICINVLCKGV